MGGFVSCLGNRHGDVLRGRVESLDSGSESQREMDDPLERVFFNGDLKKMTCLTVSGLNCIIQHLCCGTRVL